MKSDTSTTVRVTNNGSTTITVTGDSSKSSDLQVSPNQAQTIPAGGFASFTIKAKKVGVFTATFSSSCGDSKVVPVVSSLL